MKKLTDQEILEEFENFTQDKFSLVVSTSNENNEPLTNYSPFVEDKGFYYICVSSMMPHYKNMIKQEKAHILIIQEESKAFNIYARQRLYFLATCEKVQNKEDIFKLFDLRYKDSLSFLRTMKDFEIIKLQAKDKSLVLGFGAAHVLKQDGTLEQKNISHK